MGQYINTINGKKLPEISKASFIKRNVEGAEYISEPQEFVPDLVCVVENGFFDAAGYCPDEHEMREWLYDDGRRKQWLIVPNASSYVD